MIEFESINSYYTNAQQYHLLHFTYRNGLNLGIGMEGDILNITILNRGRPDLQGRPHPLERLPRPERGCVTRLPAAASVP